MSDTVTFLIDGAPVHGTPGQTILQAADAAGIYIPRLCYMDGLSSFGSCRVCRHVPGVSGVGYGRFHPAARISLQCRGDEAHLRQGFAFWPGGLCLFP